MKKFGKLKLFGLVFILMGALIFVGVNLLEADKPADKPPKPEKPGKKPGPEYTWQVVIPGEASAIASRYNLFGLTPYESQDPNIVGFIYEDKGLGDGFYVEVKKKGGGKGAESQFRFGVFNNIGEYGCNTPWPDDLGDRKIGFQGIVITGVSFADTAGIEYPCFFPPTYSPDSPYPCNDPAHGINSVPQCMADFLNYNLHPYCDPLCGHPECSYEYVDIIITANCNFEDLRPGEVVTPLGVVRVEVNNTYDLQPGCDYPHNISGVLREGDFSEGDITIEKLVNVDAWKITVNSLFTFIEIYKGGYREGGGWEYKIPYWAKIPFTFKTTWIRKEVTD